MDHLRGRGLLRPVLLPDADLADANAAFQTAAQGLRILSPLVGAGLYAAVGGGALAVFDAATFGAAIVALASVRVTESAVTHDDEPWRRQVTAGFAQLLQRVLVQVTVLVVLGCYDSAAFAVTAALDRPPAFVGVLMSVQGSGSVVAGLLAGQPVRRLGEPRALGALGCMATARPLVRAGVALDGVGVVCLAVAFGTAVQRFTPPRLQGSVGAATGLLLDVPQTLSRRRAVLIGHVDYRVLLATITLIGGGAAMLLLAARQNGPHSHCNDVIMEPATPEERPCRPSHRPISFVTPKGWPAPPRPTPPTTDARGSRPG